MSNTHLGRVLRPDSIVFIGGYHLKGSITLARRLGFSGNIAVVNPVHEQIAGIDCHSHIDELDFIPDVAFVAQNIDRTLASTRQLCALGAGGAIIHANGYSEIGEAGKQHQDALIKAAGSMAIIGPNSMGFMNLFDQIALWAVDNHATPVSGRGAAIISQSGALLFGISNAAQGLPLGYGISTGNQANTGAGELIEALLEDDRVAAIGLYLEGINEGQTLGNALAKALNKGVPVVLLKSGGTRVSSEHARSHTGALTLADDLWQALIERYALISVSSPNQMCETLKYLTLSGCPHGPRHCAVSYSGATAALLADHGQNYGISFAPFSTGLKTELQSKVPHGVAVNNPFDFNLPWKSAHGMSLEDTQGIKDCLLLIAKEYDAITFMLDVPRAGRNLESHWTPTIAAVIEAARQSAIPFAVSSLFPEGLPIEIRNRLLAQSIAPMLGYSECLSAIGAAIQYRHRRHDALTDTPVLESLMIADMPEDAQTLDEATSRRLLLAARVPIQDFHVCSMDTIATLDEVFSGPVVVKAMHPGLFHKSRYGGVHLGVHGVSEMRNCAAQIRADVAHMLPHIEVEQFLIEAMIPSAPVELLIGLQHHPVLGMVLTIGQGGIDVEKIRNYRIILLPASSASIRELIIDGGFVDEIHARDKAIENVTRTAVAVAEFGRTHGADIAEVDVNPLLISHDGRVIAVDALVVGTTRLAQTLSNH